MRTITAVPPVTPVRLYDGTPVLEPDPANRWESRVVLNPAAVRIEDPDQLEILFDRWDLPAESRRTLRAAKGACVMLYRAQGEWEPAKNQAPSYLGMAVFTPMLELVYRRAEPVLRPLESFHNLGIEDARCTRVGDTYYLYYTGYTTIDPADPESPRRVQICLATTQDFLEWDLHGPLSGALNRYDNKNPALLPRPVHGRWVMLHRPMQGPDAMAIHWAEAHEPFGPWTTRGLLMESYPYREFARSWIGAGGPPIALENDRFLMIYHQGHYTPEGTREYDLAAALLDGSNGLVVKSRIEPLMRPTGENEQKGDADLGVDNVLFSCANYRWGDRIVIPYAAADSRIFGAVIPEADLVRALVERMDSE